jgi:hypothetical protein
MIDPWLKSRSFRITMIVSKSPATVLVLVGERFQAQRV